MSIVSDFVVSETTLAAQATAGDPGRSVFAAANAGSGKTHVLTERVVRLLLSGASPSKILCLTYTKAAAAEMSNRVFQRLSGWATAPRAELAEALRKLTGRQPSNDDLSEARKLFAEALETPGGLKIQTIHAFCEAILHQFPLEANVAGHFEVMDSAESALLLAEARRRLISGAGLDGAGRDALTEAFASALSLGGEWGLDLLLSEIVSKRDMIRRHIESTGGLEGATAVLRTALGLAPGEDEAAVLAGAWPAPGFDPGFIASLAMVASTSRKVTDAKLLEKLQAAVEAIAPRPRFAALKALCIKKDGEPYKPSSVATKSVSDFHEDFADRLSALTAHVQSIDARLSALRLAQASAAALAIAHRIEVDYAALKRRRGRLDFEDLIVRTADLLSRSEAADWVHYKLDQGIDHILIDEAQDTSPRQWEVMRALVGEFFVGKDERRSPRTVFAVGDEKQSIYSFQGASPEMFGEERRRLGQKARDAGRAFAEVRLNQSFRSTADVLAAVDLVFAGPVNAAGLTFSGEAPQHASVRGGEPGLVEVWPAVIAEPAGEPDDWLTPVDVQPENSPSNRLARRIAAQIADWLGGPITVKGAVRAVTPGDVLILVRKRSGFVEAMGKALREARIPVAGADRLVITDHIAIQDLMALGRAVANAEDELSLASALKSPLFGFSDDELMALALSRESPSQPLYLALRRLTGTGGEARLPDFVVPAERAGLAVRAKRAFERLEALRGRAGFETVFAFYARILGPEGGRAALTARLGSDAGEVIDAFLDLALAEEESGQPGLDAFLANLSASPLEIKREMEHGKSEVRIMTVHASKGLEAPIVFLVDPGSAPFSHAHGARLMRWDDMPGLYPEQPPSFLWRADKSVETAVVAALKEREKQRAGEEYRRLLYVGLTRAADRLVVCGTAGVRGPHEESWLQRVTAALESEGEAVTDAEGTVTARRFGGWRPGPVPPALAEDAAAVMRPLDLSPLPREILPPRPLSPSTAGDVHEIGWDEGELDEEKTGPILSVSPVLGGGSAGPSPAIRRGLAVHRLLQVLPDLAQGDRAAAAARYLDTVAGDLPADARAAIANAALAVMETPAFASLFAAGSRAEVQVAGRIDLGGRTFGVTGVIDRLSITADAVGIVDYKTNRPAPAGIEDVPPAHILQLALYARMIAPLYPGRRLGAALLYTEGPHLIEVNAAAMEAAIARRAAVSAAATERQAKASIA